MHGIFIIELNNHTVLLSFHIIDFIKFHIPRTFHIIATRVTSKFFYKITAIFVFVFVQLHISVILQRLILWMYIFSVQNVGKISLSI